MATRRYGAARRCIGPRPAANFCNARAVGGTSLLLTIRAVRLLAACLMPVLVIGTAYAQTQKSPRPPAARSVSATPQGVIQSIKVEGNQRIEEGTIRSYLLVQPGDRFDPDRIDRSLKTLYATGLFKDVRLGRVGDSLVVRVVENPIVNRVAYEGNHKLSDDQLRTEVQLRPRAVFTTAVAEADRLKILGLYAKRGYYDATVEPRIIRLDQNRVDVVFQINDGSATLISKIVVNGNQAFSEDRLTEVINSRNPVGGASCPHPTNTIRSVWPTIRNCCAASTSRTAMPISRSPTRAQSYHPTARVSSSRSR